MSSLSYLIDSYLNSKYNDDCQGYSEGEYIQCDERI